MQIDDDGLDQIRENNEYDLNSIYYEDCTELRDMSSTICENGLNDCLYYLPNDFRINVATPMNLAESISLSTFHLNCRSINKNLDEIKNLMCDLSTDNFSFDIIGLSEIFQIHKFTNYDLSGYHPIQYKTRSGNSEGRGGIGIYITKSIDYVVREDVSVFIDHVIESLY